MFNWSWTLCGNSQPNVLKNVSLPNYRHRHSFCHVWRNVQYHAHQPNGKSLHKRKESWRRRKTQKFTMMNWRWVWLIRSNVAGTKPQLKYDYSIEMGSYIWFPSSRSWKGKGLGSWSARKRRSNGRSICKETEFEERKSGKEWNQTDAKYCEGEKDSSSTYRLFGTGSSCINWRKHETQLVV